MVAIYHGCFWHDGRVPDSASKLLRPRADAMPDLDKDAAVISQRFDRIARRYDLVNNVVSAGQARGWRKATVAAVAPRPGMKVLDLAGGTGSSAGPLAALGAQVTVCDISPGMLEVGRSRYPEIEFVHGDALALPFEGESFEVATISFGLRNVSDAGAALRELARVVRPGGRLVITEFSHPRSLALRAAYGPYLRYVLPSVAGVITGDKDTYEYFAESIKRWPSQSELVDLLHGSGWRDASYRDLTGGIVALHQASRPLEPTPLVGSSPAVEQPPPYSSFCANAGQGALRADAESHGTKTEARQ